MGDQTLGGFNILLLHWFFTN